MAEGNPNIEILSQTGVTVVSLPIEVDAGFAGNIWFSRMLAGELPAPPVTRILDDAIQRVDLEAGTMETSYTADSIILNPVRSVQGGMLGAMLDALTAGSVDATLKPEEAVVTLSLALSFQKWAKAGSIVGHSNIVKCGREVCFVNAELRQSGAHIPTANAVCKVVKRCKQSHSKKQPDIIAIKP